MIKDILNDDNYFKLSEFRKKKSKIGTTSIQEWKVNFKL